MLKRPWRRRTRTSVQLKSQQTIKKYSIVALNFPEEPNDQQKNQQMMRKDCNVKWEMEAKKVQRVQRQCKWTT